MNTMLLPSPRRHSTMERKPSFTSSIPCTPCLGRLRYSQQRSLCMALMALTVFCVAFQFIQVFLETRNDIESEGFMTLSESRTTMQKLATVPTPAQDRPERDRAPVREQRATRYRTLPMNKAPVGQRVERSFGRLMFSNSQKESHHTGDNQQVIPGEDKAKDPGLFVPFPSDSVCQPKTHIMFLKTHKTASSTIANILYRYGDTQNLTFALPVQKISQFCYPKLFTTSYVQGVSSGVVKEYDVICNHLRFNKPELEKLMPEDTFYFSIMRHPVTMFESSYMYYKSIQAFSSTGTVEDFLDHGWRNYNPSAANNQHARNNLAFDFGFNNNISPNATDLEEQAQVAVVAIERDFHLILISEYFDESMVLLKHMMCWSLDDVVSFKLNSRSEQSRRTPLPDIADKILVWNALDWRLYVHFNATFWRKVDTMLGREEMSREVRRLRQLRIELQDVCLQEGAPVNPQHIKDKSLKPFQYGIAVIQGYNLKPDLDGQTKMKCQRLITPELQYSQYLYEKQYKH